MYMLHHSVTRARDLVTNALAYRNRRDGHVSTNHGLTVLYRRPFSVSKL